MARTVRLRLNNAALHAILNGSAVTDRVEAAAGARRSAGDSIAPKRTNPEGLEPFTVAVHHMPTRAIANVYTQTYDGQHAEYHHRTLSRCLP
jgi:hypothetical protein